MKLFKWRNILLFLMVTASAAHAESAKLTEVAITATSDKARINISFSNVPSYKVFSLPNPPRLVIDLKSTHLDAKLSNLKLDNTPLKAVRSGPQAGHGLRLVFDMKQPLTANGLTTSVDKEGHRIIVEVGGALPAVGTTVSEKKNIEPVLQPAAKPITIAAVEPPKTNAKPADAVVAADKSTPRVIEAPPVEQKAKPLKPTPAAAKAPLEKSKEITLKRMRDVVIVIDPGHGGKDPGAHGANGTYEKNVVLGISKKLQELINQQPGMRAVLTRRGDYFITLRERLRIARRAKGDLFVAIHADAFNNPHSSGASVFALSASGASSEAARWLAEKENYSELGGIPLSGKSDVLRSVLIDLSQTGIISLSLQLGSSMLKELGKITRLHHGAVEQARFVVLKSLDIPSVLVETGFISNAQEEQHLNDPAYQQKLAEAIFTGVHRYFQQYPPPGTRLAADKENGSSKPKLAQIE